MKFDISKITTAKQFWEVWDILLSKEEEKELLSTMGGEKLSQLLPDAYEDDDVWMRLAQCKIEKSEIKDERNSFVQTQETVLGIDKLVAGIKSVPGFRRVYTFINDKDALWEKKGVDWLIAHVKNEKNFNEFKLFELQMFLTEEHKKQLLTPDNFDKLLEVMSSTLLFWTFSNHFSPEQKEQFWSNGGLDKLIKLIKNADEVLLDKCSVQWDKLEQNQISKLVLEIGIDRLLQITTDDPNEVDEIFKKLPEKELEKFAGKELIKLFEKDKNPPEKELFLAAVKKSVCVLKFLPFSLSKDMQIVLSALEKNLNAFKYIMHPTLKYLYYLYSVVEKRLQGNYNDKLLFTETVNEVFSYTLSRTGDGDSTEQSKKRKRNSLKFFDTNKGEILPKQEQTMSLEERFLFFITAFQKEIKCNEGFKDVTLKKMELYNIKNCENYFDEIKKSLTDYMLKMGVSESLTL